jgi:hypothetical protein
VKRISERTRREAILICQIGASMPDLSNLYITISWHLWIGGRRAAADLANEAYCAIGSGMPWQERDAEAAALLETGWSPGDPVEVLP